MKKTFSVSLGLAVGLLSFLIINYIYKGLFSNSTTSTTTFMERTSQFSGNNMKNFGSGGRPGMMGSGDFSGGTGDFRRGSGVMMRTGRRDSGTGTISAQEVFNQDTSQQ